MSADAYLDALSAFERARDAVSDTASQLQAVASALRQQPDRMIFTDVETKLPLSAGLSRDVVTFNASDWKSADEIQQILADYHSAKEAMMDAWRAVPADRQKGLQQPPAQSVVRNVR